MFFWATKAEGILRVLPSALTKEGTTARAGAEEGAASRASAEDRPAAVPEDRGHWSRRCRRTCFLEETSGWWLLVGLGGEKIVARTNVWKGLKSFPETIAKGSSRKLIVYLHLLTCPSSLAKINLPLLLTQVNLHRSICLCYLRNLSVNLPNLATDASELAPGHLHRSTCLCYLRRLTVNLPNLATDAS